MRTCVQHKCRRVPGHGALHAIRGALSNLAYSYEDVDNNLRRMVKQTAAKLVLVASKGRKASTESVTNMSKQGVASCALFTEVWERSSTLPSLGLLIEVGGAQPSSKAGSIHQSS